MQYLKEDSSGNRHAVPESVYLADRLKPSYRQVLAHGLLVVYRMSMALGKTNERPLRYGGRGRAQGRPWSGA